MKPTEQTNHAFDLEAAHIFKIQGGKLHEIEAMGFSLPLNSKKRLESVHQVAAHCVRATG